MMLKKIFYLVFGILFFAASAALAQTNSVTTNLGLNKPSYAYPGGPNGWPFLYNQNAQKLDDMFPGGFLSPSHGGFGYDPFDSSGNLNLSGGINTPGPVNIGNMGLRPPMYHNANYSALNGDNLLCDTSAGSFTVTLPSSPSVGWMVTLYDVSGSWGTNPLTLAPNGSLLMGTSANYLLQISGSRVTVIYSGSTYGWRVF